MYMQWMDGYPFYLMIAAALTLYLAYYSYKHRTTFNGRYFWILMLLGSIFVLLTSFELLSSTFQQKLWLRNIQQVPLFFMGLFAYAFARDYVNRATLDMNKHLLLLSIPFFFYFLLIFTDQWHHLMRDDVSLFVIANVSEIKVQPTVLNQMFIVYNQILALLAVIILLINLRHATKKYFQQHLILLIGLSFPILRILLLPILDIQVLASTAISSFGTVVVLYYGMFRYQLFSMFPIAKDEIFENMKEGILITNKHGIIMDLNPAVQKMLSILHPDGDQPQVGGDFLTFIQQEKKLMAMYEQHSEQIIEFECVRNETRTFFSVSQVPLKRMGKVTTDTLLIFSDVTNKVEHEQKLHYMATRDSLTGLYNRGYFVEIVNLQLEKTKRHTTKMTLLLLDIDEFKSINDEYGHLAGDQVLIRLAQKLKDTSRSEDVIGRIGGEEFGVLLTDIAIDNSRLAAERIRIAIEDTTFHINDSESKSITVSIGGVHTELKDRDDVSFDTLFNQADEMLYQSKRDGKNRITFKIIT